MKKTPEDIIILQMYTINNSHIMYHSWDMECSRQNCFVTLKRFFPFHPLTTQKIKILKKMKKTLGDITIFHRCNINDSHIIYGSWDTKCKRQNFLSFWTIFCPFTHPLTTQKIKILKNWKKHLEISFYTCVL